MMLECFLYFLLELTTQGLWFENYSPRIPWDWRPFPLGSVNTFPVIATLKFTPFLNKIITFA